MGIKLMFFLLFTVPCFCLTEGEYLAGNGSSKLRALPDNVDFGDFLIGLKLYLNYRYLTASKVTLDYNFDNRNMVETLPGQANAAGSNNDPMQFWGVEKSETFGSSYFKLRSLANGLCLTTSGLNDVDKLKLAECQDSSRSQVFERDSAWNAGGSGGWWFMIKEIGGKCLDGGGWYGNLPYIHSCSYSANNQWWQFQVRKTGVTSDGLRK